MPGFGLLNSSAQLLLEQVQRLTSVQGLRCWFFCLQSSHRQTPRHIFDFTLILLAEVSRKAATISRMMSFTTRVCAIWSSRLPNARRQVHAWPVKVKLLPGIMRFVQTDLI